MALAALSALGQFVSAFFVHVAARARPTASGWAVPATKTNVEAFGLSEVVLTLVSLGAVVLVASALSGRRSRGERGAGRLAWGVSTATVLLGLVGLGFLFGVALFILLACVTVPHRASADSRTQPLPVASGAGA